MKKIIPLILFFFKRPISSNSNLFSSTIQLRISYLVLLITGFIDISSQCVGQNTLDNLGLTAASPAAGAYSLRRLSTTYAGSAVRVRRSSDNAQQDIGFTAAGDLDQTALLAFVGAGNNGFVVIWYDQSGFSRNATQGTAPAQPRIVNAGTMDIQKGRPTLVFSGSQSLVTTLTGVQATTGGNITTANLVFTNATIASSILSNGDGGGTNRYNIHAPWSDGNTYFDIGNLGSGGRVFGSLTWTSLSSGTFIRNGTQGDVYKNGISGITSSALGTTVTSPNPIWIGSFDGTGLFINGSISEVTIFPSALSTVNRQALENNQGVYFSIFFGQIFAYEGFDYYQYFDFFQGRNIPLTGPAALHNVTNDPGAGQPRRNVTNSPTSLGWGGDWQVTGGSTAIPGYNIINTGSISYVTATRELIDAGYYAVGGSGANIAGRPFQVSTSGTFYADAANNYLIDSRSTATNPSTGVSASRIGRNGTTLYMGLLLTKNNNDADPAYVSLHKNATVTDADGGNTIQVGYFGTAAPRRWGIRLNGTVFQSSTNITLGSVALLVVKITFNSAGGNTVSLFVNPTSIGGVEPAANLTQTTAALDNTFTALAYNGGTLTNASALDEIRLSNSYASATLSSASVSVTGTFGGSGLGDNIFTNGDFGMVTGVGETVATTSPWTSPTPVTFKNTSTIAPGYNYIFNQSGQPSDGNYTIATQTRPVFGNWLTTSDRSGTSTGMLGIFNATYPPGKFYESVIPGLCDGTRYEFTVEAFNLLNQPSGTIYNPSGTGGGSGGPRCDPTVEPGCQQYSADAATIAVIGQSFSPAVTQNCTLGSGGCKDYFVNPDIEFLIDDVVAYTVPSPVPNDGYWHKYGFTFVARPGITSINLSIRNKAPGGFGNDIALDNISFRPTGPITNVTSSFPSCSHPFVRMTIVPSYATNFFQWQKSTDGGTTWTDLTSPSASTDTYIPNFSEVAVGNQVRGTAAGSAASVANPNCRVVSSGVIVDCALPVAWLGFLGKENQGNVDLFWQTSYEKNNDRFEVERSENGTDFVVIGKVKAKGLKKDGRYEYAFTDVNPAEGINYYRIRQVDFNTQSTESKIISVKVESQAGLRVFPNPAKNELHLTFNQELNEKEKVKLRLLSSGGQIIKTGEYSISPGKREILLNVHDVAIGIYILEVTKGDSKFTKKIVKTE